MLFAFNPIFLALSGQLGVPFWTSFANLNIAIKLFYGMNNQCRKHKYYEKSEIAHHFLHAGRTTNRLADYGVP